MIFFRLKNYSISKNYSFYFLIIVMLIIITTLYLYRNINVHNTIKPFVINQLTKYPPMGWNSWNKFKCGAEVNEDVIKKIADTFISSGLKKAGFNYIIIDDCWQGERNSDGILLPNKDRFPNGIASLADYIHSKGLKLGLYTSVGAHTCAGFPGSLNYEEKDLNIFSEWGVDYIKVDWCDATNLDPKKQLSMWRDYILKSKKPLVFSVVVWPPENFIIHGRNISNMWRTTGDIEDNWDSMIDIINKNSKYTHYGGQGAWNDPDMLEVGNGGMSLDEYKTHFGMWAMMSAPLILGNDIRNMDENISSLLTNTEIISVDQDRLGIQAKLIYDGDLYQIWSKPLYGTALRAVAIVNISNKELNFKLSLSKFKILSNIIYFRDLWTHKNEGFFINSRNMSIPPHGMKLYKIYGIF
jgi:alpha-galactosidase